MKKYYTLVKVKPFEDIRGKLLKIVAKSRSVTEENIEEIYVLYSKIGAIRGNHYHKKTVEYFSVLSGTARVAIKDMKNGEKDEIILSAEDNSIIRIPEYSAHAFENIDNEPLIIIAISSREYNESDTDTYLIELLKKHDA